MNKSLILSFPAIFVLSLFLTPSLALAFNYNPIGSERNPIYIQTPQEPKLDQDNSAQIINEALHNFNPYPPASGGYSAPVFLSASTTERLRMMDEIADYQITQLYNQMQRDKALKATAASECANGGCVPDYDAWCDMNGTKGSVWDGKAVAEGQIPTCVCKQGFHEAGGSHFLMGSCVADTSPKSRGIFGWILSLFGIN